MEDEKKRLVLVDGNAILHRAYHALPALTTRNGELVNAVYGFSLMLFKIFSDLHPQYLAVSFDTAAPNFRQTEFVGYKANRPRMDSELAGQIEKVHQLVNAFNIPIVEVDGYEADDVIATLAAQASKVEVVIVTGDKDLMQLVNDQVKLYMPTRGLSEGQIVGVEEVREKMGVPPDQIVDYKGLVGDQSDNYPGVPGIGPKTAIALLEKFGTIEGVYQRLGEIESKTVLDKLALGAESAVLSKKLAKTLTDVPVSLNLKDCVAKDYDRQKVRAFFKELGFRSLVGRLDPTSSRQSAGLRGASESQQSLF